MRLSLLVFLLLGHAVSAWAAHSSIAHTDVKVMAALVITAGNTGTTAVFLRGQDATSSDLLARSGLGLATDISALVQGAGTSPNYKVEALCSMDGITFVKPETGGDLGTFTDSAAHFVVISVPLSPGGIKLKFTELGLSNQLTASSTLAGQ